MTAVLTCWSIISCINIRFIIIIIIVIIIMFYVAGFWWIRTTGPDFSCGRCDSYAHDSISRQCATEAILKVSSLSSFIWRDFIHLSTLHPFNIFSKSVSRHWLRLLEETLFEFQAFMSFLIVSAQVLLALPLPWFPLNFNSVHPLIQRSLLSTWPYQRCVL